VADGFGDIRRELDPPDEGGHVASAWEADTARPNGGSIHVLVNMGQCRWDEFGDMRGESVRHVEEGWHDRKCVPKRGTLAEANGVGAGAQCPVQWRHKGPDKGKTRSGMLEFPMQFLERLQADVMARLVERLSDGSTIAEVLGMWEGHCARCRWLTTKVKPQQSFGGGEEAIAAEELFEGDAISAP
jgi:hypothetical protein